MSLDKEMKYYEADVAGWHRRHAGEYPAIKDESQSGLTAPRFGRGPWT